MERPDEDVLARLHGQGEAGPVPHENLPGQVQVPLRHIGLIYRHALRQVVYLGCLAKPCDDGDDYPVALEQFLADRLREVVVEDVEDGQRVQYVQLGLQVFLYLFVQEFVHLARQDGVEGQELGRAGRRGAEHAEPDGGLVAPERLVRVAIRYPEAEELAVDELAEPLDELVGLVKGDQAAVDDVWAVAGYFGFRSGGSNIRRDQWAIFSSVRAR